MLRTDSATFGSAPARLSDGGTVSEPVTTVYDGESSVTEEQGSSPVTLSEVLERFRTTTVPEPVGSEVETMPFPHEYHPVSAPLDPVASRIPIVGLIILAFFVWHAWG